MTPGTIMPSTLHLKTNSRLAGAVSDPATAQRPAPATRPASFVDIARRSAWPVIASIALTALMTVVLIGFARISHVNPSIAYLVPVLIAAVRWGAMAGIVSALAGAAASAFFFYPPIYDLRVHDPQELVDLVLFLIVAGVTSHLANTIRNRDNELQAHKRAETFRDALIRSVSHELRTPLSSIVSSMYLLANAPPVRDSAQLAMLANDAKQEAERLNDYIQNLLDASRITSAGIQPQLQWADVSDIVNAAVDHKAQALASHRLEFDIQDELPLAHVDPVLVEQAVGQIVDNAAKYSKAGSTIRIEAFTSNDAIAIAVTDQGAGLTDEERAHIWDRFYRSPRHIPLATGSGLGLWIARAFLTATGGRVDASSDGPDRGTTMTVRLPAPTPDANDVKADD